MNWYKSNSVEIKVRQKFAPCAEPGLIFDFHNFTQRYHIRILSFMRPFYKFFFTNGTGFIKEFIKVFAVVSHFMQSGHKLFVPLKEFGLISCCCWKLTFNSFNHMVHSCVSINLKALNRWNWILFLCKASLQN